MSSGEFMRAGFSKTSRCASDENDFFHCAKVRREERRKALYRDSFDRGPLSDQCNSSFGKYRLARKIDALYDPDKNTGALFLATELSIPALFIGIVGTEHQLSPAVKDPEII